MHNTGFLFCVANILKTIPYNHIFMKEYDFIKEKKEENM